MLHVRFFRLDFGVNSVFPLAPAVVMSAGVVTLQAQVESVLGALVKAASLELVELFESRYRASEVGRAGGGRGGEAEQSRAFESLFCESSADSKRSIGVQVEEDICPPLELGGSFLFAFLAKLWDSECI